MQLVFKNNPRSEHFETIVTHRSLFKSQCVRLLHSIIVYVLCNDRFCTLSNPQIEVPELSIADATGN